MSSKDTLTLKEKFEIGGKKALATTLIALGAIGMAGCADKVSAEPKPSTSQSQTETPSETPSTTTSPTEKPSTSPSETPTTPETPDSEVPKNRDNWVVNKEKLGKLGNIIFNFTGEDITALRADACTEFLANNPLEGGFATPSPADSSEMVEKRFEAKQQLFLDYLSDTRNDGSAEALKVQVGVQSCLTNAIDATGSRLDDYQDALDKNESFPTITNRIDYVPGKEADKPGGNRFAQVTVSTGQEIPQVWRLHSWNPLTNDWDLTKEQTEDPRMGGWK